MFVGDNFVLGLLLYATLGWVAGWAAVAGFAAGLTYGAWYHDRSERTGARAWGWVRRWRVWQWLRRFYRHTVVDAGFLASSAGRADVPVLYAAWPHGVNSWSFFLTFMAQPPTSDGEDWSARLGRPHVAVLNLLLAVPLLRDACLALGAVSVDRAVLEHLLLERRTSVALIPGGTRDISPSTRVPPPRRTGFLRLAYEAAGAVDVVPVYMENEDRIYWTWGRDWPLRQWMLNHLGFALTPYAGPLPTHPLRTHMGARHLYRSGESFEDYIARWFAATRALEQQAAAAGKD